MVALEAGDEVEHYTAHDERGEELCAAQEVEGDEWVVGWGALDSFWCHGGGEGCWEGRMIQRRRARKIK